MAISGAFDIDSRQVLSVSEWQELTASDTTELSPKPRAIMVTTSGTLTVEDSFGNSMQFTPAANTIYSIRPFKVMSTGTAASGIFGLY